MEDAIVAQVEWYMGRVNLASDAYLKERMDNDLWVDLGVILDFPKMIRMGVRDKAKLAALLHARSSIVEVDVPNLCIRPAWARRSTLFLHDLPQSTRLDDVLALLQKPRGENGHVPGLLSVQPAADSVWLAIFDSPTGAQNALPYVKDKTISGVKIRPEVHVETALDPQAQQNQPDPATLAAAAYGRVPSPAVAQGRMNPSSVYGTARSIPTGAQDGGAPQSVSAAGIPPVSTAVGYAPMMGPMGMPVPVMHHPQDNMHPQYAYAPPASYISPGYGPHNVGVPRQYVGPRGMSGAPANYMVAYPQGGHPFDPTTMGVAPQAHGVQRVAQPVDEAASQNSAAVTNSSNVADATRSKLSPGAISPESTGAGPPVTSRGDNSTAGDDSENVSSDYSHDVATSYAGISTSDQMSMPAANAPGMEPSQMMGVQMRDVAGKATMDPHYAPRGAVIGDPNTGGLSPGMTGTGYASFHRGNSRGQNAHQGGMQRGDRGGQRTPGDGGRGTSRGSGGGGMDSTGRGHASRKGRKGNRNNSGRHGHGDRHTDGRGDGKADASGSPGNREDRRGRDDKPKPEPNLNSMHFPPLPMANDAPTSRTGQAEAVVSKPKDVCADVPGIADKAATDTEIATKLSGRSGGSEEATNSDTNTSLLTEAKEAVAEAVGGEASQNASVGMNGDLPTAQSEYRDSDSGKPLSEKKAAEGIASTTGKSNGSTLSYAAILRSKKPTAPRPHNTLSRGASDTSTKSGDSSGSAEGSGAHSNHGKEHNPRRRKSTSSRGSPNGDPATAPEAVQPVAGVNGAEKPANKLATGPLANASAKDEENVKSRAQTEATRPNSVWANKPRSLFQAAGTVSNARTAAASSAPEVRKVASPVSSQEDDGVRDKVEGQSRSVGINGQLEATSVEAQGSAPIDGAANHDDLPDVKQISLGNTTISAAVTPQGEGLKATKGDQVGGNGNQAAAKGAWAMGGPKTWPKSNGNGVVERLSSTSNS